jgi:hypothetical protein
MIEFIDSIKQVRANTAPYKDWVNHQKDIEARRNALKKQVHLNPQDSLYLHSKGRTIVDAIDIMDDYSENKAEDIEVLSQQIEGLGPLIGLGAGLVPVALLKSIVKNPGTKTMVAMGAFPVLGMVGGVVGTLILGTTLQKNASRIARFQARETELKDPKKFVVYTPEQLQAASELTNSIPDAQDKKESSPLNPISNTKEIIHTMKSLLKDKKAYKAWLKQSQQLEKEREKLFNVNPTAEQLVKAKADQDLLFRLINKIDIYSQDYSENVEMATNSMVATGFVGGGVAGAIVTGLTKLVEKIVPAAKNLQAMPYIKKFATPVVTIALGLTAAIYATKLQKEAARVGRFKAKQELLKDPHNFKYYNETQMNSVSNVSSPIEPKKNFFVKFKDGLSFFFKAKQDFKEYNQYKKTDGKKEEKIRKALEQIPVTQKQIEEAKILQDKTFRTFDKMDEMSQRYSEDVEAGTTLIQQGVAPFVGVAGSMAGLGIAIASKSTNPMTAAIGSIAITLPVAIGMEAWATKLQKQASKIGLMKAMQDLKDPRHFVEYTEAQKSQAQAFNGNTPSEINNSKPYPNLTNTQVQPGDTLAKTSSPLTNVNTQPAVLNAEFNSWLNMYQSKS